MLASFTGSPETYYPRGQTCFFSCGASKINICSSLYLEMVELIRIILCLKDIFHCTLIVGYFVHLRLQNCTGFL